MNKKQVSFKQEVEEQISLNYQSKKLLHMIELQIMDIQSTLHYIQKKHSMNQVKQAMSQIYHLFNETEPLYRQIKALFIHTIAKKLMNCFGIIYVILTSHIDARKKRTKQTGIIGQNDDQVMREIEQSSHKFQKETVEDHNQQQSSSVIKPKALGGIYLYNQNYARHLCLNRDFRFGKNGKDSKKNTLTNEELKKEIMQDLNDNTFSQSHPDEILDIFTFKFKYGRQNQLITFHDELQSIAKFFKNSQNEAFQFLSKTKDQNSTLNYNDSFSDIMSQLRLQKDVKIKQFTKKIKEAFKSIKRKTQSKINEIQQKLQEVEQIKNSIKPPETAQASTQTSRNFEEQIKFLQRKIQDAEQKYKFMSEMKKKELQQNTLIQLQYESQLSLKARELVYLKLKIQQNGIIMERMSKRLAIFQNSSNKIKQKFFKPGNSKQQAMKIMANMDNFRQLSEAIDQQPRLDDDILISIRKQRKQAKKIIIQTRRNSLHQQKSMFIKRFTQQFQQLTSPNTFPDKWALSSIAESVNSERNMSEYNQSTSSNKNNQISKGTKKMISRINITGKEQEYNNYSRRESSQSIKSALGERSRKQTKEKNVSHIVQMSRKGSFLKQTCIAQQIMDNDSIFNDSSTEKDIKSNKNICPQVQLTVQQKNKMQSMYTRQMAKIKQNINHTRQSNLSNLNKSKFYKRLKSQQIEETKERHFKNPNSSKNTLKPTDNFNLRYQTNKSFGRASIEPHMQTIIEKDDCTKQVSPRDIDKIKQMKQLMLQNKSLKSQLQNKNNKIYSLCQMEINISIKPLNEGKYIPTSTHTKMTTDAEDNGQYSELQHPKYSKLKTAKEKNTIYLKQLKTNTQFFVRSATHSNISKPSTGSQYLRKGERSNGKSLTRYLKYTEKTIKQSQSNHSVASQNYCKDQKQCGINQLNEKQHINTVIKQEGAQEQKQITQTQQEEIREIAIKCKNIQDFKLKIKNLHIKTCGVNCSHLQKYLSNFSKYRLELKEKMRMHIENLHNSIDSDNKQLPIIRKKKK